MPVRKLLLVLLFALAPTAGAQFGQIGFGVPAPDRTPGKIDFDEYKEMKHFDLLEFVCTERDDTTGTGALAKMFSSNRRNSHGLFYLKEVNSRKRTRGNQAALYAALALKGQASAVAKKINVKERGEAKAGLSMLSVWAQFVYDYNVRQGLPPPEDAIEIQPHFYKSASAEVAALAITAAAFGKVGGQWEQIEEDAQEGIYGIEGAKLLYRAMNDLPLDTEGLREAFQAPEGISMSEISPELAGPHPLLPDKAAACRAIGIAKFAEGFDALAGGLNDPDIRTQIEAAKALRILADEGLVEDEDVAVTFARVIATASWPVLIEATAALGAHPDKRVVPLLMQRLQREDGRMRSHVLHALGSITGDMPGTTAEDWISWYRSSYKAFVVDKEKSQSWRSGNSRESLKVEPVTTFYGQSVASSRFALVLDTSKAMDGGKIYELRKEALEAMRDMKRGARYAMIGFDDDLDCVGKHHLTDDNRAGAFHAMALERGPNIRRNADALYHALSYPEVDTVYFVSGGNPIGSRVSYWPQTLDLFRLGDRYRPVDIHVLSYGLIPAVARDVRAFTKSYRGTHTALEAKPPGTDEKFIQDGDTFVPDVKEELE